MRALTVACALALCPLSVGSVWAAEGAAVEVWPSRARTLEDGSVEYFFDLRPLKAGKVAVDPGPDEDPSAVKAFLASLPNETRVVSRPEKATFSIDAPGGLEGAPYAASFSGVDAGPFVAASDFDRRPTPAGIPALHPDAPKLLPSADLLLWKHDVVQDGVVAGLSLATDTGEKKFVPLGRKALVERLLKAALMRYQNQTEGAKEGARRLAVWLGGVLGASTGRIPDALLAYPELRDPAAEASARFTRPEPRFPPSPRSYWSDALNAATVRERALGEPLGVDREGHAAVLTLLAILDADPKLRAAWEAHRKVRDRLLGRPRADSIEDYRAAAEEGGATAALDDLSVFLDRLSSAGDEGAAVMSRAESPVSTFVDQLHGPEQLHAIDELTLAVQDGRYSLAGPEDGGWAAGRHRWAAPLLRPAVGEGGRVFATGGWRDRLVRTFQALFGLHAEVRAASADEPREEPASHAFKVRLKVPPHLELEPLPGAYAEAAGTWARLEAALKSERAAAKLNGVLPDGSRRRTTVAKDAQEMSRLYRGLTLLSRLSLGEDAARSDVDHAGVAHARRFLAKWRADADLAQDVRYLLPASPTAEEGVILHSGVFGVSRREIEVRFERPPELEIRTTRPEQAALFVADPDALQRYQVPVLATGAVQVPRTAPLELEAFRRICDRAGRTREAIEAALPGALVRSLQSVSQDMP